MGHEGKILVKKEDKRFEQSSHTACNLFGGLNSRPTNHDGETLITTEDKSIHQLSQPVKIAITDSHLVSMDWSIKRVLEHIIDDKIYSVGIVGMGGTGKTTLAKEVGKKGKELNVFDLVVFIHVSVRINEKKIQDQIAEGLGLRLVRTDLRARAKQIFLRLQSEERILVILDDIWNMLDLQQIGISNSKNHMGCKLVLTSHNASVVKSMECQYLFHQYLLSDEETWSLFLKWAGNVSLDPSIINVSLQFVKKCRGLPLAALLVGGGLRGKPIDEWVAAIAIGILMLQDSQRDFNSALIFSFAQWSYKVGLSSKVARSLFLISGLFPESEIPIEHLSHYAITLGLCGENEVNAAINSLIYCGLLMHYDESKDHVIMHDLVRDVALVIVNNENPAHRDSIRQYTKALSNRKLLSNSEDFWWEEELDELLHQVFHVRESSSTSSIVTFSPHVAVIAYSYTHPEPSGKLVDFKGLCQVDESYLPLLKEACNRYPQLIKCQAKHSKTLKQTAFNSLGHLLFMLNNASVSDWVYLKDELKIYWEQTLLVEFDLEWLKPVVDKVLSSTEIHRIEALRKEEEKRKAEAAKLRQQLTVIEAKAAKLRLQLNHVEPEAAITDVSVAPIVTKVTRRWNWKVLWRRK